MNVVYHAVAAVLLFLALQRGTGYLGRSFLVAALFALHPLNIESVAWVSERKNVLSAIFWFLAILAYGWYAFRPNWKRYFTVAGCFALGLMSKSMVITLPCVLLLLDLWPLCRVKSFPYELVEGLNTELKIARKSWSALVFEKIPLFLLSAANGILTIFAQTTNGGMTNTAMYPVGMRIENAIVAYILYIYKGFLPYNLSAFYPHPHYTIPHWKLAACAILLIVITAAALRTRSRHTYFLVGWLWFLGTLVPVIGLLQNGDQAMADRYAYTPLVGIFLIVIWGAAGWVERNHSRRIGAGVLVVLILAALIADTRRQLQYWHDSISLFSHALKVTENNDVAEMNIGEALSSLHREQEAVPHFLNALRYQPTDPGHHYNYGRSLFFQGRDRESIEQFTEALRLGAAPRLMARTHHNMAVVLVRMGRRAEAKSHFELAIGMNPESFNSYLMLGLLQFEDGELEPARKSLQESVRIRPSDIGYFSLGQVLERQGKLAEAKAAYERAAEISPDYVDVKRNLDALQRKLQDKNSLEAAVPGRS